MGFWLLPALQWDILAVRMKTISFLGILVWCGVTLASGQSTNRLSLEDLRQTRLPDVVLESVTAVAPDARKNPPAAEYVEVKGLISGNIRFELLLPDAWNGRFVMGGGGGFVGTVQNAARDSVNRGYATVGTDTGHESQTGYLADWARDNLEAQLDFGYLAVHRTTETAKALIRAYYRTDATYDYFVGCSRGGGQAMMEAQRYPKDFDGIVAGAPAFNWPGIAATMVAIAKALYPDPAHLDSTVLTKDALEKLREAVIEQCDTQDGLKDGIIENPPSVHFDLAKVPGLTDGQRQAIQAIYQGARNDKGLIYPDLPRGRSVIRTNGSPGWWGRVPGLLPKDHTPDLTFALRNSDFSS